jgi:succinate dehydrogenase / fumarate reductase, cytochrome b subunit
MSAINPKGPRLEKTGEGSTDWTQTYLGSTVGQKILVAITGSSLVLFVIFHLIGNLKIFQGADAINHYAHFLKHDLGALIWIARAGLLGAFLAHVGLTLWLKYRSNAARPVGYAFQKNTQGTTQSKNMLLTGIVILAFIIYHLAHFTFGVVQRMPDLSTEDTRSFLEMKDPQGRHHVYNMMIAGFKSPAVVAIYVAAQLFLFFHLSHGIQSVFQTLGLVGKKFIKLVRIMGYGIAAAVLIGNLAIVVAVWIPIKKVPAYTGDNQTKNDRITYLLDYDEYYTYSPVPKK